MTEVVLVNPRMCSRRSVRLPLSLLHLGAVLEGKYDYRVVDGNLDDHAVATVLALLGEGRCRAVGVSVMPGPQVAPAIAISSAIRSEFPGVAIVWGGYFPTLYPDSSINAPYVDYLVRGQGEETLVELLELLEPARNSRPFEPETSEGHRDEAALAAVRGLTWKRNGSIRHNPDRAFRSPNHFGPLPYERVGEVGPYLRPSFMGRRTGVHQAAIGCRYHCEFCGVVSMFGGETRLSSAGRLFEALMVQRDRFGVDAMQFYDHNFFDTEDASVPLLEALAKVEMPWWCYARADTLANFSPATWELIRKSRLRMAYIGAEAASDEVLKQMKKGSRVEHTFAAARLCREHGVIPEFSFVLGGPADPEGEIENTFGLIKQLKAVHPECEVILYFYSPTPRRSGAGRRGAKTGEAAPGSGLDPLSSYGPTGPALPETPEEWTEKRWIDYVCHRDAPWLTRRIRRRVRDFSTVLGCRFPTVQDYHSSPLGKQMLKKLASWRYERGVYGFPAELELARRLVRMRNPRAESI